MHVQLSRGYGGCNLSEGIGSFRFVKYKMTLNARINVFKGIFMSIHKVSCIPLSFKEGGGYSPPSPSPKSATGNNCGKEQ